MREKRVKEALGPLTIAALGIVFGDIGTSPLYAFKSGLSQTMACPASILGILSLIFWSLCFLISVKYLYLLFRADNEGEGGILSLLALMNLKMHPIFLWVGILGAGLMLGDSMLTPAISVMSAVEGLNIIFPEASSMILPLTSLILFVLFYTQSWGTGRIGKIFGPMILLWFITLAILGIYWIYQYPGVYVAMNPYYAISFLKQGGTSSFLLLGSIFLVMTGGEALYADLGHFGKKPIRVAWFFMVLPALILNYFGQGALLLSHPEAVEHPFFYLAPALLQGPLVILATFATIIASQAVIAAAFSLTRQAMLLGFYPHMPIVQTSLQHRGQIYIPQMNMFLMIGTLLLVFVFKRSEAMAHAYGVSVNLVMLLTLMLVMCVARQCWHWGWLKMFLVFSLFVGMDSAFFAANLVKIKTGGWMPLLFASVAALVMHTWSRGRRYVIETYGLDGSQFMSVLQSLHLNENIINDHVSVFLMDMNERRGGSFLHFLTLTGMHLSKILIVDYVVLNIPYVSAEERFKVRRISAALCEVTLNYGFMEVVSIPQALYVAHDRGLLPWHLTLESMTYFLEIPNVVPSAQKKIGPFLWQARLFSFLVRNDSAQFNIQFYQLPYHRTIALGAYYFI